MSEGCDWSLATNGLGEDYNITRMTFKNHGCCGHAFAAIDGALALSNQHQFDPADILNIRVDGYSATVVLTLLMIITMTLSDVMNNTATAVIAALSRC